MSIANKFVEIAEKIPRVFDAGRANGFDVGFSEGFLEGDANGFATCRAKHYTEVRKGDGTNTFLVNCGFKPDFFVVFSTAGYPLTVANRIIWAYQDFRGVGKWSSRRLSTIASGERQPADIKTSAAERFFPYADGRVGYYGEASTSSATKEIVFDENTYYTAICVKYTDKTDKQIITEVVNALPESGGTVDFAAVKVNATFTEEEWQKLIASKPKWTFSLTT